MWVSKKIIFISQVPRIEKITYKHQTRKRYQILQQATTVTSRQFINLYNNLIRSKPEYALVVWNPFYGVSKKLHMC